MKQGWEYGTLEDAVKKGSSNISLNKIKDDEGEYPIFSAKGFAKNVSFFQQEQEYLAIIKDGAGIGRVAKYPAKSSVVATMQYLIPKDGFDIGFIEYFLRGIDFEKHRSGSTIPHVYFKDYKSEAFPLIPLLEQQRIVEILDKAFVAIDKAKQNAEQNLSNAKEGFENYLQGVFENKGADWEEKQLDELCDFSSGGTPSKKNEDYWTGDIPWVSGRDMKSTRLSDSLLHISRSAVDESATRIAPVGTLLILVRGMGLAHGAQIAELMTPCAFNQDIKAIHSCPSAVPRYLLFALRDRINTSDTVLSNAAHGTLKIDSSELKSMVVFVPPLEYQQRTVAKIDLLTGKIRSLETNYKQKLTALAELKKSILQKAFRGEL